MDLINVQTFVQYFIEVLQKGIIILESNVDFEEARLFFERGIETVSILSTADFAIQAIKKAGSIPSKLFVRKYIRMCKGIAELPEKDRLRYVEKISGLKPELIDREASFILNVVNLTEEEEKLDFYTWILIARLEGIIDEKTYRRMITMVDQTLYSDIIFMRDHISDECFTISSFSEEGLKNAGWIRYEGMGVIYLDGGIMNRTETNNIDTNMYKYSDFAKLFCEVVLSPHIQS